MITTERRGMKTRQLANLIGSGRTFSAASAALEVGCSPEFVRGTVSRMRSAGADITSNRRDGETVYRLAGGAVGVPTADPAAAAAVRADLESGQPFTLARLALRHRTTQAAVYGQVKALEQAGAKFSLVQGRTRASGRTMKMIAGPRPTLFERPASTPERAAPTAEAPTATVTVASESRTDGGLTVLHLSDGRKALLLG